MKISTDRKLQLLVNNFEALKEDAAENIRSLQNLLAQIGTIDLALGLDLWQNLIEANIGYAQSNRFGEATQLVLLSLSNAVGDSHLYDEVLKREKLKKYLFFESGCVYGQWLIHYAIITNQLIYANELLEFVNKFEYTPAQYLSTIFWELSTYFQENPCLAYRSLWKKVDAVYGKTPLSKISKRVVADISRLASEYCNWNDDTLDALWDFSDFVSYPFITDGNGNYLSVSNYTLKNGFFEKLYWMIRECYPDEGAECMSFFGRLFERYIQDLTRDAVDTNESKQIVFTDEFSIDDDRRSSDAYIQRDDKLIIIEVKGYSILQNTLKKNEQNSLNIKKLYLDPVTEADCCFTYFRSKGYFSDVSTAYIISITMDCLNAVPEYISQAEQIFWPQKKSHQIFGALNLCVEEYEMLMYLLEENVDIFQLLQTYFSTQKFLPFSTYLKQNCKDEIKMTSFMKHVYNDATDTMKQLYGITIE